MLLTILAVHTAKAAVVRAAVVRRAVSRAGAVSGGGAVAVAVGVLTWEEEKLPLLIGFCIHFLKFSSLCRWTMEGGF